MIEIDSKRIVKQHLVVSNTKKAFFANFENHKNIKVTFKEKEKKRDKQEWEINEILYF